jgi:hypothetical protein
MPVARWIKFDRQTGVIAAHQPLLLVMGGERRGVLFGMVDRAVDRAVDRIQTMANVWFNRAQYSTDGCTAYVGPSLEGDMSASYLTYTQARGSGMLPCVLSMYTFRLPSKSPLTILPPQHVSRNAES